MSVIRIVHYPEAVTTLRRDPIVIGLAHGLAGVPREDLTFPDNTLRTEFMSATDEEYRKRGGTFENPEHPGAVGEAVISILDRPLTSEELYHDVPSDFLEQTVIRLEKRMQTNADPALRDVRDEILTELERRSGV